ncbi:hypothetical protein Tco_0894462 [Tanacetum coccineum]|uniref:Uncharacterized protein n=1 Tax=Tanacetum coccineum TaxID=301880 RepID=A0ABQ5CBV9_9ASTR
MACQRLHTDYEVCMYALTVSTIEPKKIKEAIADHSWNEPMQDELNQFERLQDFMTKREVENFILLESGNPSTQLLSGLSHVRFRLFSAMNRMRIIIMAQQQHATDVHPDGTIVPQNKYMISWMQTRRLYTRAEGHHQALDNWSLQHGQTLCKIFSKCLTTRVTGWDQPPLQIMQMLYCFVNNIHVDYAELLWEGLYYSLHHPTSLIPYPRFTKIIISHYMTSFLEISRRARDMYHNLNDEDIMKNIFNQEDTKTNSECKFQSG